VTKRFRKISVIVFSLIAFVCGSISLSVLDVRADLVAPSKEGAKTLLSVYENGLTSGSNLVWGQARADMEYVDSTDPDNKSKTIALDCTQDANTEFYIDFGKDCDIYTGNGFTTENLENFYKKSAVEFWIKLNDTPASFFNIYLFQSRGAEYASAPANQRYIRSNVQLKAYVDTTIIGAWQYVQVPFTAFSSSGEYVNENNVKVKDTPVDLSRVCAIGFAHMMDNAETKVNPTVLYDDIRFVYGNMDDENLGVTVIPAKDYEDRKKQATFTTIDIRSLATSGYYGGRGVGWTNQGSDNELTGFDLEGEQEFFGVPFDMIVQAENDNKSVIGLRSEKVATSRQFVQSVSIPINLTVDGLYIIHNAAWGTTKNIAKYTWVYEDETTEEVNIDINKQIYEWWGLGESAVNPIIWQGETPEASAMGIKISLNMFAFANPEPTKKVKELKCEITSDVAACMIVAVTAADFGGKGMFMAERENIYSPDTDDWYAYTLADLKEMIGTPLDVSYLIDTENHGKVTVKGDDFVFEDGTKANFWGVNINAYSLFQSHENTETLVNAIAAGGYNLIRILDWDSSFYYPNIFGYNGNGKDVAEEQLDQFNYFWAKCKEKGIYIDFVMLGGRFATADTVDGKLSDEEIADISQGFKMEVYIDERLQQATKTLVGQVLGSINPYTNTKLANDRVLAMLEITNESNLMTMYDDSANYQFKSDKYRLMAQQQYAEFLKKKYNPDGNLTVKETENAIKAAWKEDGKTGFDGRNESLADATVLIGGDYLSDKYSAQRCADGFEFFYTLSEKFYSDMNKWAESSVADGGLGVECPMTGGSNFAHDDRADLFLNAHYDYIARHSYQSHPTTGTEYQVGTRVPNGNSSLGDLSGNTFALAAFKKVMGLPYIVTESLIAEPNIHSAEFNLIAAAIYSYQGWSLTAFTYMNKALDNRTNQITNSFIIMDHPGRFSTITSASLLYQRAEISKATVGYYRVITVDEAMDYKSQSLGLPTGTYVVGKTGIYFADKDGNLLFQSGNFDISETESDASILEKILHSELISEGGEMIWNENEQTFVLNTKSTQGAVGYIGGRKISLDDVEIEIETSYAQVTVSALGAQVNGVNPEIATADNLLITAVGQSRNTGAEITSDGTTIKSLGTAPVLVQPILGKVVLKTYDDFEVYILDSTGRRVDDRAATFEKDEEGYTVITLKKGDNTTYYEIVRTNVSETKPTFGSYRDIAGEYETAIEAVKDYLPGKTDTLFRTEETTERGDFIGAVVKASGLTGGNRAYADANSLHWAYEQFKTAREYELVDGLQIKAYDELTYKAAYFALYNALKAKNIVMNENLDLNGVNLSGWNEDDKAMLSALVSVKVVGTEELSSIKSADVVKRGKAADYIYKMTTATNADDNSSDSSLSGGGSNVGLILGITIPIACIAIGAAVYVIIRKKRLRV